MRKKLQLKDLNEAYIYKEPRNFDELWDNEIVEESRYERFVKKRTWIHKHRFVRLYFLNVHDPDSIDITPENFNDWCEAITIKKRVIYRR